jgi:hypothetical protein
MTSWQTVLSIIAFLLGTVTVNLIIVSWYMGRRTALYDNFGPRLDRHDQVIEGVVEITRDTARDVWWIRSELRRLGGTAPNGGEH